MANPFVAHCYDVLISSSLSDLIEQVNELLKKGAKPVGGICLSNEMHPLHGSRDTYLQAMAIPIPRKPKVSDVPSV